MKMGNLSKDSLKEVFEEYFRLAQQRRVEENLKKNYDEEIVLLTNYGKFYGYKDVNEAAKLLKEQLPDGTLDYKSEFDHSHFVKMLLYSITC